MPFDNFFAYRQTDAGAIVFALAMQALEQDENPLGELWRDADAVVLDSELAPAILSLPTQVNLRRWLFAIFHRVADEILKQLH